MADPVDPTTSERPAAVAIQASQAPVLDGVVLGDAAWDAAPPFSSFWQTSPFEGRPASETTDVRVLYTESTLYIGVVAYDREPQRIIVSDSRRDAPLDETDGFSFILDTYQDGQNGFVFGTNPAGIEFDAQVTNEGSGSFSNARQSGGAGSGVNVNWDGAWEVQTQIHDEGWSAEFAIPFSTLRFPSVREQAWGINFRRTIRRRNETAYWAPLPRQFDLYRVSLAGTLTGIQVPSPRNLKVMPYVLSEVQRDYTGRSPETEFEPDFGLDVKYGITPSLTLDATYNTDFAQVEVDEQQVNLDRFSLFFPEKRPFFLENAGLFAVGDPGAVELFFSRRIGIGPDGQAIPILGGARLSGNVAGTSVGLLNMQTEEVGAFGIPTTNFAVARVRRELPNRSSLGAIFTNKQQMGDLAPVDDYNRVVAADGRLGIGTNGLVTGFVARSFTPGIEAPQEAFQVGGRYDSELLLLDASYSQVGAGFNPEVGFLQRTSYRKPTGLVLARLRPDDFIGIQELRPHVSYRGWWGFDGFQETGFLHVDNHWEWRSGHEIHTGINFTREGVRAPFVISEGVVVPAGTYDHREAQIVAFTDQGRAVSLNNRLVAGGFFGGDRVSLTSTLRLRVGDTFNTEVGVQLNDVSLPGGDFTSNLLRARLSYSFTPRIYLQSLIQYNDQSNVWSANLRFGWLRAANTGLFVVFNQVSDEDALTPRLLQGRTFVVKYTHLFDVLQ